MCPCFVAGRCYHELSCLARVLCQELSANACNLVPVLKVETSSCSCFTMQ